MEIFVVDMSLETIILEVDPTDTIANLKKKIKDRKGFPADEQCHLVFRGRELEDDRSVGYYSIQNNSTLNMVLPVPGKYFPMKAIVRAKARRPVFPTVFACLGQPQGVFKSVAPSVTHRVGQRAGP